MHGVHVPVFNSENLPMKFRDLIEAVSVNDGVNKEKALPRVHILLPHRTELLRWGEGMCDG